MRNVLVIDVQIGDVIQGPDGPSRVMEIILTGGLVNFNFAEKNHCWWGLSPNKYVVVY